jgi:tRNA modification GTPase
VTSDESGTTRDALEEPLDLSSEATGAGMVTLVDLAGLDEALQARSAADAESQRLAQRAIERCDVALLCDPTGRFELAGRMPSDAVVIRLRTKADRPHARSEGQALEVCSLDGRGLGALRRAIADSAFASEARGASEAALVPRRRAALERALGAVESAGSAVGGAELTAQALREAVDALGELAGRVHPDDIIGRIFATFCIGK